nr:hypothetical protein [Tanacetum cinerariifolium]
MSLSLAENVIVAGADNCPPMLDKTQYSSWASLTEPGTTTTPATVRDRRNDELTDAKKIREVYDIKATNIVLQGLPQDIYNMMNHHEEAKHIWDRVKLLIECFEISLQERDRSSPLLLLDTHQPTTSLEPRLTKGIGQLSKMEELLYRQFKEDKIRAFETDDLDAFDSDCDEAPSASVVLMAKLSLYDSKILFEMAAAAQNTNNTTIRFEGKLAHMEQPLIPLPYPVASQAARDAYNVLYDAQNKVACLMLGSMSPKLQMDFENYKPYDTIQELTTMFEEQAKQELFEIVKAFYTKEGKIQKDKKKPRRAKGKDNGKNKLVYAPKPKNPPPPKRDNLAMDSVCYHFKEVGHWRRNYPSYQAELKKRKNASVASTLGIFTVDFYAFPNKTWVYDTGCGTHICNTLQGIRGSRKLKHGALSLYIGNGMRAVVEAIGSFDLVLPSGLIIFIHNCHFAPTITKGVVLVSRLVNNGYIHTCTNYGISIPKDNMNKRAKHALESFYLWHYRLGYINKKCMDKLQRDGILQPTHHESLQKCKSCISRKMARKPFPHQVKRAKDLLGLIHTDVCGSFRTVSREGASYFITFTYDFSYYGDVYLMKHKHEVFETFKVFQDEVENQLEKDTQPSKNTSKVHNEVAPIEVEPQNVKVPIHRSTMIPQGPDIYGFHVDVEEYELGDLNEPPNYKASLSDPEFDKWLESMNTKMQSMKDNQVWVLVDLPPNGRTLGSKWIFKKKNEMDGNVNKARGAKIHWGSLFGESQY